MERTGTTGINKTQVKQKARKNCINHIVTLDSAVIQSHLLTRGERRDRSNGHLMKGSVTLCKLVDPAGFEHCEKHLG